MAIEIEGDSPEAVALYLFDTVKDAEGKTFQRSAGGGFTPADRKWILDTYAECILAVWGRRSLQQPSS